MNYRRRIAERKTREGEVAAVTGAGGVPFLGYIFGCESICSL